MDKEDGHDHPRMEVHRMTAETLVLPAEGTLKARLLALVVVVGLLVGAAGRALPAPAAAAGSLLRVVVQKVHLADGTPERAIHDLGGHVEQQLPIVDGFS